MNSGWKHAVFLVALLALLTYLFNESRDPDRPSRLRTQDALRTLELHDAELSRDVLMARAGQLPSYDALMQDRQSLLDDVATLKLATQRSSDAAAQVVQQHLGTLETAVGEKLRAVEHFKSDNALARNSLMYLTYSVAILDADAEVQRLRSVESAHLQHTLLRFVETLDSNAGREIKTELDRLARAATGTGLPILIAHGRLIVEVLPRVDGLLRQIVGASTTVRAHELEEAMRQYATGVEARAQIFRYAMYFFSLVLFGYLIHQFVQLRTTARDLRASNTQLQQEMAERTQAEIALKNSEQRYRAITQFANEAIIATNAKGHIVSWNVGASALFGYRAEQMAHKSLDLLMPQRLHGEQGSAFLRWRNAGLDHAADLTVESVGVRRDGTEFPVEISRSTWSNNQGSFEAGIIRDISARKQLENTTRQQEMQLIQANKMTALGTLVSGVAHEINNPNQFIMMNARVLSSTWADALEILDNHAREHGPFNLGGLPYQEMRETLPTLTHAIEDGTQRIERIVNGLKDFARPRTPDRQASFQLNHSVRRALSLLNHLVNQRTSHFSVQLDETLPTARGDAGQIEQVFINLLVNALESLPEKSRGVSVSTRFDAALQRIVLVVQDEGSGIAAEHLSRVCDPFFTTKQESGGTGLGLAISAAMIHAHHGQIQFDSRPGAGTRVSVMLRCMEPPPTSAHPAPGAK